MSAGLDSVDSRDPDEPEGIEVWRERAGQEPPWVIVGMVHGRSSLVYGHSEAGKGTTLNGLVEAVTLEQPTFLGREVRVHGPVCVVTSDDPSEWARRLTTDPRLNGSRLSMLEGSPEDWDRHVAALRRRGVVLAIYDAFNGLAPADADSNTTSGVRKFTDKLDRVYKSGHCSITCPPHREGVLQRQGCGPHAEQSAGQFSFHQLGQDQRIHSEGWRASDDVDSRQRVFRGSGYSLPAGVGSGTATAAVHHRRPAR